MKYAKMTEAEAMFYALTQDESGLDMAEFMLVDDSGQDKSNHGIFRAWPFQVAWFRNKAPQHADAAGRAVGKAIDVNEPILTVDGWKTMGKIEVGDYVFSETGEPVEVLDVFRILKNRDCYKVSFDDGSEIIVDGEHNWSTIDYQEIRDADMAGRAPKRKVRTTVEIMNSIDYQYVDKSLGWDETYPNHRVPFIDALNLEDADLTNADIALCVFRFRGYPSRNIVSVEPVDSVPVRCIRVDNPTSLFLVGHNLIPTHNSLSIKLRAVVFPLIYPDEEMVITAPESVHLEAVTDNVERAIYSTRLYRELLEGKIKHKPFHINWQTKARTMGRIPQRDGRGVQGCSLAKTPILTKEFGFIRADEIQVGNHVWGVNNDWTKVTHNNTFEDIGYQVKGVGALPITINDMHRFYGKVVEDFNPKKALKLSDNKWFDFHDMKDHRCYWSMPRFVDTNFGHNSFDECDSEDLAWILGLYAADGVIAYRTLKSGEEVPGQVCILSHPQNTEEITSTLDRLGRKWRIQKRSHSSAERVEFSDRDTAKLASEIGRGAENKSVPPWILFAPENIRRAFFEGYMFGDGTYGDHNRRESSTVSEMLAMGIRHLALSLGYFVTISTHQPKTTHINGVELKSVPKLQYRLRITENTQSKYDDNYVYGLIKSMDEVGVQTFSNLVTEDHTYVSAGIVSHNTHPIILEHDEGAAYPEPGWIELVETVIQNDTRSRHRVHGVSFGQGGRFNEIISGNDPNWTVTRLPAMVRPNWNATEREKRIVEYGGYDSSGYRRNIMGLPSDGGSPIFTLNSIMAAIDQEIRSTYNTEEYYFADLNEAQIRDAKRMYDAGVESLIQIPASHMNYDSVWIGMDIGWTLSPSSICVFAEVPSVKNKNQSALKLISRILLNKFSGPDQARVIAHLMRFYRPMVFAMDATGAGKPLWDFVEEIVSEDEEIAAMKNRVKNINFGEKVIVDFDESLPINRAKGKDAYLDQAVRRPFIEASTDAIRKYLDSNNFILPNDIPLQAELQAAPSRDKVIGNSLDAYGRSGRKKGMHNLDAIRCAVFSYDTRALDQAVAIHQEVWVPPDMIVF